MHCWHCVHCVANYCLSGWLDCCPIHLKKELQSTTNPKTDETFLDRGRGSLFFNQISQRLYICWMYNVSFSPIYNQCSMCLLLWILHLCSSIINTVRYLLAWYLSEDGQVACWTKYLYLISLLMNHLFMVFLSAFSTLDSLLEEGGGILTFEGSEKRCTWKTVIRIHNPQFYWKVVLLGWFLYCALSVNDIWSWWTLGICLQVATEADFGFADTYINGDISFVDKNEGLLNLFRVNGEFFHCS